MWSTCVQAIAVGHMEVWRIYRDTPGHRRPENMSSARFGRMLTDSNCSVLELHRWNDPEKWTRVWRQQCFPSVGNFPKNNKYYHPIYSISCHFNVTHNIFNIYSISLSHTIYIYLQNFLTNRHICCIEINWFITSGIAIFTTDMLINHSRKKQIKKWIKFSAFVWGLHT